jgi:hypothetical protein
MIKEILKGNINASKEESLNIKKRKNKRINSVLYNFDLFKRINLKKKSLPSQFEKVNSLKIIHKNNDSKIKNNNLTQVNTSNNSKNKRNNKIFNSYSLKRKKNKTKDFTNMKSFNDQINSSENLLNITNINRNEKYFRNNYGIGDIDEDEDENGQKTKKINISNLRYGNNLYNNNYEKELEIRLLKNKLEKLKKKNISLNQKLGYIIEQNNIIEKKTIKEQNKRKDIICSLIDINNNIFNKNDYQNESSFKNLLFNLMDLKYKYGNAFLKNDFLSNLDTLFSLSNILNENKNLNGTNNILNVIQKLIQFKGNYIDNIKKYKILQITNQKYYNYIMILLKKLNLNDLNSLHDYLVLIKSSNDEEIKKINRMKNVLYADENNSIKRQKKFNSSVDYLTTSNRRNFSINFNYVDLQKYFIKHNRNKKSYSNGRNLTLKNEKINYLDKNEEKGDIQRINNESFKGDKTFKKKINFIGKDIEKIKRFKTNIIYMNKLKQKGIDLEKEKEKEKENNSLYYPPKNKIKNIPHNYFLKKKILMKNNKYENSMNVSRNFTLNEENPLNKRNYNRINKYSNNTLKNKLNNSTNINSFNVQKYFKKNIKLKQNINENSKNINKSERNNDYNNNIKIKKKSLNLRIPSLKSIKNYQ